MGGAAGSWAPAGPPFATAAPALAFDAVPPTPPDTPSFAPFAQLWLLDESRGGLAWGAGGCEAALAQQPAAAGAAAATTPAAGLAGAAAPLTTSAQQLPVEAAMA
mmetsp:Transcript_6387/g.17038  ORF Transcript_6387/g.17038 Transcript_6387/m.17038 type:complete len:105 (-) Transcript_6387:134-448(-)|eukprot:1158865-Pelagomonas_calceolata.AAC.4